MKYNYCRGVHRLLGRLLVPSGAAVPLCILDAPFDVGDQGFADAQVLGVPEGVDIGQLTVVEVNGTATIDTLRLKLHSAAPANWEELGVFSQAIDRAQGRGVLCTVEISLLLADAHPLGWGIEGSIANNREMYYVSNTGLAYLYQIEDGAGNLVGDSGGWSALTADQEEEFAIVLGGYNASKEPWYPGASGTFEYGGAFFIRFNSTVDWIAAFNDWRYATTPLYVTSSNYNVTDLYLDDLRVPSADLSAAFTPLAVDTFTGGAGELAAHGMDYGGLGWTEDAGDWEIDGAGKCIVNGPNDSDICTCDPSMTSGWIEADLTPQDDGGGNFTKPGIVFRYANANSFLLAQVDPTDGNFELLEQDAGWTFLDTVAAGITDGVTYRVKVHYNGTSIHAWCDNQNRLDDTNAFNQAETKCGFRISVGGSPADPEFDNWHVWPRTSSTYNVTLADTSCEAAAPNGLLNSLIAYWPGDEVAGNALDAHTNGLDLTDVNTVTSNPGHVYALARQYTAANTEYHWHADDPLLDAGTVDLTIAQWCYINTKAATRVMVSKGDGTVGQRAYVLQYEMPTDRFRFYVSQNGGAWDQNVVANTFGAAPLNTWCLVLCYHDAANDLLGICVNNGIVDTQAWANNIHADTKEFVIGATASGIPGVLAPFNGRIGPSMMWKSAAGSGGVLTAAQRTALWNSGIGLEYTEFDSG